MTNEEIDELLQGKFELNCPKIVLTPFLNDGKREVLTGTGFITLNSEEGFFELKVIFEENVTLAKILVGVDTTPGQLFGKEIQYNLIAHDISGKEWVAERFIPEKISCKNGSMITGNIPELSYIKNTGRLKFKDSMIEMYFIEKIEVPHNAYSELLTKVGETTRLSKSSLSLSFFQSLNIEFEINNSKKNTVLLAKSRETKIDDNLINHFVEAFQFVTSYTDSWSILSIRRNNEEICKIRGVKTNKVKSTKFPPIKYSFYKKDCVWELFEKYLEFLSKHKDFNHPIADLVKSINESIKISLDAKALTLSISIETLLREAFLQYYKTDEELEKNLACVSNLILESGFFESNFKSRMLGTILSMKNARAKDILFALRDNNLIDKELVENYGIIRNKSAHGANNSGADIQIFFMETNALLVLFYQLLFLVVKYNGKYTDYSAKGYPEKEFIGQLPNNDLNKEK